MPTESELVAAYAAWALQRIEDGFIPSLVTMMFNPLPDSAMAKIMEIEAERIYATLLTRHFRRPSRIPDCLKPMWIGCADYPVPKEHKDFFLHNAINNGRHLHFISLDPPFSRIREGLAEHVFEHHRNIVGATNLLRRLDVQAIIETPEKAANYAFKSIKRHRATTSEMLIFPRLQDEMPYHSSGERRTRWSALLQHRQARELVRRVNAAAVDNES